ncbi:MAG: hypothetical protein A2Y17_05240 [Clostridiales bacterium GWF2_38_85]|nr:MAG: hypothetical protein A2Y17_05240 [Clostridiales bacterium GWF2_38_85]HBL83366.1 hypothetical protein [Clostridiales bacterium]
MLNYGGIEFVNIELLYESETYLSDIYESDSKLSDLYYFIEDLEDLIIKNQEFSLNSIDTSKFNDIDFNRLASLLDEIENYPNQE